MIYAYYVYNRCPFGDLHALDLFLVMNCYPQEGCTHYGWTSQDDDGDPVYHIVLQFESEDGFFTFHFRQGDVPYFMTNEYLTI